MKYAFSLIELIFSIVIIAIAFISIPTLIIQSSRMDEFSIKQEAILAVDTKIKNILSYRWDQNSLQNNLIKVLDVPTGDITLMRVEDEDNKTRVGHFKYPKRRSFFTMATYPTGIVDGFDDIDDFNGTTDNLLGGDLSLTDYKKDINLTVRVGYVSDNTNVFSTQMLLTPTNLKMIEVKADEILMRAYSANIGERELLRKSFQ